MIGVAVGTFRIPTVNHNLRLGDSGNLKDEIASQLACARNRGREAFCSNSQKVRTIQLLPLIFSPERRRSLKLLCLGAHSDDIEIGCGGTVLRLISEIPNLAVRWVVFSATKIREAEARNSAAAFLQGVVDKQIDVRGFRDGYFPFQGAEIKDSFEAIKADFDPTLIMTHRYDDAHQDHSLIDQLTHNTFS